MMALNVETGEVMMTLNADIENAMRMTLNADTEK